MHKYSAERSIGSTEEKILAQFWHGKEPHNRLTIYTKYKYTISSFPKKVNRARSVALPAPPALGCNLSFRKQENHPDWGGLLFVGI